MARNLLSAKDLENAKPRAKEYYLIDGGGLYARVLKAVADRRRSPIVFQYRFKISGRTGYYHCGTFPQTSLKQARVRRDDAEKLVAQGLNPTAQAKRDRAERDARERDAALEKSLEGLFEDWERVYLKSHRKDGGVLVRQFFGTDVLPQLGTIKAKDVTRTQLVAVIDAIVHRGARRKANAVLSMLKQMFKHGLARGIVDIDPIHGLSKSHAGGKEKPRNRTLSDAEIRQLAAAIPRANLPSHLIAALWLLLATGARVAELMHASWDEFDLAKGTWTIPATRSKNGRPHLVHLSPFALRWLDELSQARLGPFVFPGRRDSAPLSEKWLQKSLRDRQRPAPLLGRTKHAGVLLLSEGEWRVHDLRRTMATGMGNLGIAPHVVEKCLNHSLGGLLVVYQHQEYLTDRKSAFDAWGAKLELMTKTNGAEVLDLRAAQRARSRRLANPD